MVGRKATPAKAATRKSTAARKPAKAAVAKKPLRAIFARPLKEPTTLIAAAAKRKPEPTPPVAKKPKLVRDSFAFPKAEYTALEAMKTRAQALGRKAKKGELVRAGLASLAALGDAAFVAAIDGVPRVKAAKPKTPQA